MLEELKDANVGRMNLKYDVYCTIKMRAKQHERPSFEKSPHSILRHRISAK